MLFEYRKLVYADGRYNDTIVRLPVSKFFKIITRKVRKVYVLSKNLHQSVPYAKKRIMLSLKIDGEWIEIKFEVETKFKMDAIANFVGWRHKSRDSTLAIEILGVIGCFVAIIGTVAMSIVSAKSRNAYCFSGQAPNHPSVCVIITFLVTHITGHIGSL